MTSIMPKTGRTRASLIQETEDSSSITVSAPPFKRRRGRPPKDPLQSKKPRTAPSYRISDPAIVSTSKPIIATPDNVVHKLRKKRKRPLSEEVRPIDLQTVCQGCGRKSYHHGEHLDENPVIKCYKCKKD